ncbi:methylated-DNA--[protein]-cysteine S-methyltransferase [Fulvivirga sp. RKSG066]|nr:methylated-DNA--[protein]-cysteine S-methyltransferase [Fulvivirga aurantia]
MATASYESPIGSLTISADDQFLLSVSFHAPKVDQPNEITRYASRELDAYFSGKLKTFTTPLKYDGTEFQNRVWRALNDIPYGQTISYSELAVRLGDIKCIRAAGTANGKNQLPIFIPCHRVIGKNGNLVGFAGGLERKRWLLKHEGVIRGEQIEIFA